MSEQTLKQKTTAGFFWSFLERFFVQGVQFILQIVLARLLFPSDFGLIAMMTVFITLSRLFIDSGFASALIQKQNRTEEDFSTVFYFNIMVCLACYLLIFVSAPYISNFYRAPELKLVIRIFFISLLIDSLTSVQITKLRIELAFKKKAITNAIAVVVSGTIGVSMAYLGFGVWSLVMQAITFSLVTLIVLIILVRWKPIPVFSMTSFKHLYNYGSKLLGAGLIDYLSDNLSVFLIGRYFSKNDVGYYNRGLLIPSAISNTLMSMLDSVTFPVLTSIQDDKEYLIGVFRRIVRMVSFLVIPTMTCLAFISEPFVRYVLTEKWMPIVPLMQWICFARFFTPINLLNMSVLTASGRSDLYLKINLVRLPIMLTILIIAISIGLEAVVIGTFIMSIIGFFINSYMPGKLFGYGAKAQLKDLSPTLFSVAIMFVVMFTSTFYIEHGLLKMIVSVITGAASYFVVSLLIKREELKEIQLLIISGYKRIRHT